MYFTTIKAISQCIDYKKLTIQLNYFIILLGDKMISQIEIFKSTSLNPYTNLATEKFLLDTVPDNTLRLFLWQNENTVVIGRNQNPWVECNCEQIVADGGFVARRLSGGGAVFHDIGNLNFTFICREENYSLDKNLAVIKKACEYANITAEISGRNDILVNGKKFSGNAFYHTKGKAYHHGTLLISSDAKKIERYLTPSSQKLNAKGVKSVKSRVINLSELSPDLTPETMSEYLIKAIENVYGIHSTPLKCIDEQITENYAEQFSRWEYIFGKTPPFSVSLGKRFAWGEIEINLNLSHGKIAEIKVFTDSLDFSLAKKTEKALLGAEFDISTIDRHLKKVLDKNICNDILSLIKETLVYK